MRYWNVFTAHEWGTFTADQWGTFEAIAPTLHGLTQFVSAVQLYQPGIVRAEIIGEVV